MDPADILRNRGLGLVALVLAVVLVAVGVQQIALRAGDVEPAVLLPLAAAAALAAVVLLVGLRDGRRHAAGGRRTPYW